MPEMSKSNSENYSTRIPHEEAEKIEEFRKKEGLNKSEGIRELVMAGLAGHEQVEKFRAEKELAKDEAVREVVEKWADRRENGPFESLMYSFSVTAAFLSLYLFCVTILATAAVAFADVASLSPIEVAGLFLGLLTGGFFLVAIVTVLIYRLGIASKVDRHFADSNWQVDA